MDLKNIVRSCSQRYLVKGCPWDSNPTNGECTGARQIGFTDFQEILEMKPILKAYIYQAIEVEKAVLKVELKKHEEYFIPEERQNKFEEIPALKTSFEALTPGRQRVYILHYSHPNIPKLEGQEVKNVCSKFSMERDKMSSIFSFNIVQQAISDFKTKPLFSLFH